MAAKVTISGTIPVAQYANVTPSFEVEGETHEAAVELGLRQLQAIWDRVGQKPLEIDRNAPTESDEAGPAVKGEVLKCWASGTEVVFDPIAHTYRRGNGPKWLGGSTFASRYTKEFPAETASANMAAKHGVDSQEILDMWALNAHASATVGTAIHAALQLRGEYGGLSRRVKDGTYESALSSNPVLRPIVEAFYEGRDKEIAKCEAFVADPIRMHCGQIDRLLIEDDGLTVEDWKTNKDVHKAESILPPFKGMVPNSKLGAYWLQLSFYARILIAHGKIVKGLRVHHWTGSEWKTYEHEVIDLDAAFEAKK